MNGPNNELIVSTSTARPMRFLWAFVLAAFAVALLAGSALAASGNLVKNGSFEKDSNGDGIPNLWDVNSLTSTDKRVCNQSYIGSCSFRIVADGTVKTLKQTAFGAGLLGDQFTISAWTKGKDIINGGGAAQVVVQIDHTGGGTSFETLDLPEGNSAWTHSEATVTAAADYSIVRGYLYVNPDS